MGEATVDLIFPIRFEHTYAEAVPTLSYPWRAQDVPDPRLLVVNTGLAEELGIDPGVLREPEAAQWLVGQVPEEVPTAAQGYAGHQFGSYSPRLGDGRAVLLGEVVDREGDRRDLHLKGSGRTPFARGGDGKAVVGPMLREYLMGEAMHHLGIPTTRALSVAATGEQVWREGPQPGAVLCRVASSHLRVGTFEYAAASGERDVLRALADYAIDRHYPHVREAKEPYLEFLREVVKAQAHLVVQWMGVGFVHGVMNTDNTTISGETIDYGPCAFLDAFDPATVFSSIDHGGRYAFGNQPPIAQWNLARLAEALLPLMAEDPEQAIEPATAVLREFGELYDTLALDRMSAKLGLVRADRELVDEILGLLHAQQVDYTGFFRALAAGTAAESFSDPVPFEAWAVKREALLPEDREALRRDMDARNPAYIPRNHLVEEALALATTGDLTLFHRLLDAMSKPFDVRPGLENLQQPDPERGSGFQTFCGT